MYMVEKKSIILWINKRNLFNDVFCFDTTDHTWKGIKWSELILSKRKHHASCVIGDTLVFHGGLDWFGYPLNEMVAFDLSIGSLREIVWKDHSLENISGHTFVSVVNDKTKGFPNYDHPTDSYTDLTTKTK